ncbi:hypothetical protein H2201_008796, partial [Coniosporium apollinis]
FNATVQEYHLLPENIYNMDEKGFLPGIGARCKIIYHKDFGGKQLVQGKKVTVARA